MNVLHVTDRGKEPFYLAAGIDLAPVSPDSGIYLPVSLMLVEGVSAYLQHLACLHHREEVSIVHLWHCGRHHGLAPPPLTIISGLRPLGT